MERKACHLRKDNESEDIEKEDNEMKRNEWEGEREAYYTNEGQEQEQEDISFQ